MITKSPEPRRRTLSFEFFPPVSVEGTLRLWRSVERLAPLGPKYVSVTYGAGGTTRERTMAAIKTILDRARIPVAGHLTCVGASREETLAVAREYQRLGVRKIVALRGDPPKGEGKFRPHPEGFNSAAELVTALRSELDLEIAVGAYPEVHPEALNPKADIENLKRKIDAGATSAITQFFFETDDFLRFRDDCVAAGIDVPIHPGILPIENFEKMSRFAERCGARVPQWLHEAFSHADDEDAATLLAIAIATEQCDTLFSEGVEHLHFYTLNNPDLPYSIARAIGFEGVGFQAAIGNSVA
jgi:methylenetetrahydrofolate reductase (NADH)